MRLPVILVATLFTTAALGQSYEDARQEAYWDALGLATIKGTSQCAVIGTNVANIMVHRLNGVPMSEQMDRPDFKFYQFVIRDAYKQPFYTSREVQSQLVRDFRERYESECYDITQ